MIDQTTNCSGKLRAIATLLVFLLLPFARTQAEDIVQVGVAKVDVTPDAPIRLHGYLSRKTPSVGVDQHIFVKAIAIGSDASSPAILVTLDGLGFTDEIAAKVSKRLEAKTKIPRNRIAYCASHTHSAPLVSGLAPNIFGLKIPPDEQKEIDRYTQKLVDDLEMVAHAALADLKPAKISWGQGKVDFAANRRTAGGPVDQSLPLIKVESPEGAVRAVVVGYACHCTTIDPTVNKVSGDWSGYAQAEIEKDNPGCLALVVIGCGGDANPNPRGRPGDAPAHGRAIADEAKRLLKTNLKPISSVPECKLARLDLPLGPLPTRAELEELVKGGGPIGHNAQTNIDKLDRGEPLQSKVDYVVQSWAFGDDLNIVFLAGEVVVDYSLRIKREFDPWKTWVAAYANDDPCYIPSERILREGGYEGGGAMVYYAKPAPFEPGLEDKILSVVHEIVPNSFEMKNDGAGVDPPALTPKESLVAIKVPRGLEVELAAAEPLVFDPVAIDFGGDGKLWVADMRDYPMGLDGRYQPGGEIRVLTDQDGDGRYDHATVFLDKIPFPTGVMAWRKGVLVCAAPEIFYAEDRDGDGKADVRKTLYSGFATENYQARVNGLAYGLDNWVYGANGLIGGRIKAVSQGKGREFDLGARDFRIKPDSGEIEPASGLSQQGRIRNDWGDQFGNNNSVFLQHYPVPEHVVGRNPFVSAAPPILNISKGADWNVLRPISQPLERFNDPGSLNRATSACGPAIYRDDWLGESYSGDAFICEPVHNIVRRLKLVQRGTTFTGEIPDSERDQEFLASSDNWFRPVQAKTGPDGALYIVDMYRYVIEHPRWISPGKLAQDQCARWRRQGQNLPSGRAR